jgi:threonine-phosphate decarboxylase
VENIIVGNGSTELISLFIQIEHPKKAMILGPTYSEYEREIALGGGTTLYYPLQESHEFQLDIHHFETKLDDSLDLLILCNPNNPTSSCISQEDMRYILDVCKEHDIYVMVDETYIEFVEDVKHTSAVGLTAYYNNIIILRGTSKFFAAPGLRLGYAITGNPDLIRSMNQRKNPWTINSLAVIAGELMFRDEDYITATRELILQERSRLYDLFLQSERFHPYKPTANFMLLRICDETLTSNDLFERAIKEGMMIRDCSTFPFLNDKYIRLCFMNPEDNDRLVECLMR